MLNREKIINVIGDVTKSIAEKKAGCCMGIIRQPKVPKNLMIKK